MSAIETISNEEGRATTGQGSNEISFAGFEEGPKLFVTIARHKFIPFPQGLHTKGGASPQLLTGGGRGASLSKTYKKYREGFFKARELFNQGITPTQPNVEGSPFIHLTEKQFGFFTKQREGNIKRKKDLAKAKTVSEQVQDKPPEVIDPIVVNEKKNDEAVTPGTLEDTTLIQPDQVEQVEQETLTSRVIPSLIGAVGVKLLLG